MKFSVSEYVRWEDIDAAGIINYQAYLRFFGLAEVELFRSCGLSYRTLFDELLRTDEGSRVADAGVGPRDGMNTSDRSDESQRMADR